MTEQSQPTPLTEAAGTSDEVRRMLEMAQRGGGPSEAQLAGLAARVAPAVGLPLASLSGAAPAVGTAPASAAGAAGGSTSMAPPALLGGQAGGAVAAKSVLAKIGASALLKGLGLAGLVGVGAAVYAGLGGDASEAPPAALTAPSHVSTPAVVADPPQAVAPQVEVTPLPVEPEAQAEPVAAPPVARARPASPEATAAAAKPSELELMGRAQAERSQPAAMLRTLARHQRLYPGGMLAQERDVLRIEALVKLGRVQEAQRRAAQLESAHPGSPHLARVRELLDGAR